MALKPGDTLLNGHYGIVRLLGRGGYGFVYLAQDTLLGEDVAIKELIPALVGDEASSGEDDVPRFDLDDAEGVVTLLEAKGFIGSSAG